MIASVDNVGFMPNGAHVVPVATNTLSPVETTSADAKTTVVSLFSSAG